jgi:hypothetical protein
MPVGDTVPTAQYVVTHEYGHLTEFAAQHTSANENMPPPATVQAAFAAANRLSAGLPANSSKGLSEYGRNNAHEAYAEAFAEWTITGGKTDSAVAATYASIFGWPGAQPANVGTLSVKSGLSPDRVAKQLANHPELQES